MTTLPPERACVQAERESYTAVFASVKTAEMLLIDGNTSLPRAVAAASICAPVTVVGSVVKAVLRPVICVSTADKLATPAASQASATLRSIAAMAKFLSVFVKAIDRKIVQRAARSLAALPAFSC